MSKQEKMVIATFRVLLATCVQQYGKMGALTLTRSQMEAAGSGTLAVSDAADGSVTLKIKNAKSLIRPH